VLVIILVGYLMAIVGSVVGTQAATVTIRLLPR
jgi:hypothetical protein